MKSLSRRHVIQIGLSVTIGFASVTGLNALNTVEDKLVAAIMVNIEGQNEGKVRAFVTKLLAGDFTLLESRTFIDSEGKKVTSEKLERFAVVQYLVSA